MSATAPDSHLHSSGSFAEATKLLAPMTAVVVCGGIGTRMGPVMKSAKCKSLLPVLGWPCLAYVLEALKRINCSQCILSIDRQDIYDEVDCIGKTSDLAYLMHMDSGRGPTVVAQEASRLISSARFLVLYGHQIIFPDHLNQMIAADVDFVATIYANSSEGTRKVATLDTEHYCVKLRRGGPESPAAGSEVYLDKPYILQTEVIRNTVPLDSCFHPDTPADAYLRPQTILRYAHSLYTIPATFRHEFHYASELEEVALLARTFRQDYHG